MCRACDQGLKVISRFFSTIVLQTVRTSDTGVGRDTGRLLAAGDHTGSLPLLQVWRAFAEEVQVLGYPIMKMQSRPKLTPPALHIRDSPSPSMCSCLCIP